MYTLGVRRRFIARHALVGGDWGRENYPNSHSYLLELHLLGQQLDQHGFLVDIVEVEKHLDAIVDRYRDAMLNDLPEFAGLNPSLENFARIMGAALSDKIESDRITGLEVRLWEDDSAWVAYSARE